MAFATHQIPTKKTAESAIFFFKVICRFHIRGCGKIKIKRSEAALKEAAKVITLPMLRHSPSIQGFQYLLIGMQVNIARKNKME